MKFRLFIIATLFITISCSSTEDLSVVDYKNPELTIKTLENHIDVWMSEKNYDKVQEAYNWIAEKDPNYFESNYKKKQIELLGLQGRYEKQLELYESIFPNDSVNQIDMVAHFFYQVGNSFFNRAVIDDKIAADTIMLNSAIHYYRKSFMYDAFQDIDAQSAACYAAARSLAMMKEEGEAYKLYQRILEYYPNTIVHKKAYFKLNEASDPTDIKITDEMELMYSSKFNSMNVETIQNTNIIQNLEEKNKQEMIEEKQQDIKDSLQVINDNNKLSIETDSLNVIERNDTLNYRLF